MKDVNAKIFPARLNGTVSAIASKSQAHRALICAALADGPTSIGCRGDSDDIRATVACLSALGAAIERRADGYTVKPLQHVPGEVAATLACGESGSTFRFLLPIAGALGLEASFVPQGRLPKRPLSPMYGELVRHGCVLSPEGSVPFLASGQLLSGSYELDGGISSQFISGLLFALPLLEGDSALKLTGQVQSLPYIDMTLSMLETFGIDIAFNGAFFSIRGGQSYLSPGSVNVEGDWSNAAFWLCAGALSADGVTCTGLDLDSWQGDRAILDILSRLGAQVEKNGSAVSVAHGTLRGTEIDAKNIPDLVPVLAVVCAVAEGTSVIRNAERLRIKESDRLSAITSVLRSLGADIDEREDGLIIRGVRVLKGGQVASWGDHRIAMSAAIASSACTGPVVIQSAQAVNKSYPGFFEDMRSLGGSLQIEQS